MIGAFLGLGERATPGRAKAAHPAPIMAENVSVANLNALLLDAGVGKAEALGATPCVRHPGR